MFDPHLFGYGLGASIFDTIGKAFALNAWSVGPVGIVGAFCELSNVGLVAIESVREKRVPTGLEFGSFFFAILGALWFVIPAELYFAFDWIFCCRACNPKVEKKEKKKEKISEEEEK